MVKPIKVSKCIGAKSCSTRWNCSSYKACIDFRIAKHLGENWSPRRILRDLREILPALSDFVLLNWIARVSKSNGYQFSRPYVDHAIRESNINEDGEVANFEASEVRKAFGVFGRTGRRIAKNTPEDGTRDTEAFENGQTAVHSSQGTPRGGVRALERHFNRLVPSSNASNTESEPN